MNINRKLIKMFAKQILKIIPLISFPKFNVLLFRLMGYNIHWDARIYSSCQIMGDNTVEIKKGTFIGHETLITGGKSNIIIGENCDISDRVNIFSGTHKINNNNENRRAGEGFGKDIIIGNGVWIGFGSNIMPGVRIGDKSIIAAGTLVNKDVEENTIVGGNPMKVIRKL